MQSVMKLFKAWKTWKLITRNPGLASLIQMFRFFFLDIAFSEKYVFYGIATHWMKIEIRIDAHLKKYLSLIEIKIIIFI